MTIDWEVKLSDIIKLCLILFSIIAFIITIERWRQSVDDRFQSIQTNMESSKHYSQQNKVEIQNSLDHISNRLSNIEWKLKIHYELTP